MMPIIKYICSKCDSTILYIIHAKISTTAFQDYDFYYLMQMLKFNPWYCCDLHCQVQTQQYQPLCKHVRKSKKNCRMWKIFLQFTQPFISTAYLCIFHYSMCFFMEQNSKSKTSFKSWNIRNHMTFQNKLVCYLCLYLRKCFPLWKPGLYSTFT